MARALVYSGDTFQALDYGLKAVSRAENVNDLTWALRQLGWTLMQKGDLEDGKATYVKALQVFRDRGVDESQMWVKADKAYTYADWGQIAAIVGRCDEGKNARAQLANLLPDVIFSGDRRSLSDKLEELDRYVTACRPGIPTQPPPDLKQSAGSSR